ncbi:TPA: superoxide dismutase family protein [Salmonella enterica]|nr:superoxide dismutase family protein [Salmonella enterica]
MHRGRPAQSAPVSAAATGHGVSQRTSAGALAFTGQTGQKIKLSAIFMIVPSRILYRQPGVHGFHIHENPSCMPGMQNGKNVSVLMAGGHLDPEKTGKHLGPYNDKGHLVLMI